jgi:hypothetical protein
MRRASPPASSKRRTICWAGRRRDRVRGDLQHVLGRSEGLNWLPRGILAAAGIVVGSTTSAHAATATRLRGQHLSAPRLIRGRPPAAGAVASEATVPHRELAWTAARVTLSGPDVLVELAHLYSNPCLARRRSLSCAIELVRHCARPTTPRRASPAQARPGTHRRADRCIPTWGHPAALAVQFQIHRATVTALLQQQK